MNGSSGAGSGGRTPLQTSTQIGLQHRPSPACLVWGLRSSMGAVLHPWYSLSVTDRLQYCTQTRFEHDRKSQAGLFPHPHYPKAPPHWRTSFLDDCTVEECQVTPPAVISEMKKKFKRGGGGGVWGKALTASTPQTCALTLQLNQALNMQPGSFGFLIMEEPFLSTTHSHYRRYDSSELLPSLVSLPPGPHQPPLDQPQPAGGAYSHTLPHRAPPPFCQPRLRPKVTPLSDISLSVYRQSYPTLLPPLTVPALHPTRVIWNLPRSEGVTPQILGVPKMYSTENQGYGSKRVIVV
ncbi:stabilizer of axonemal microtubules 3 isoform X2 [Amia ocellicauda]|uniref:stabilizer of axonemal microtubules 3 isoform X2 n=1 Tax=Amia ocellicauda TaxID=2972642 RepID=UPI003463EF98